MAGEGIQNLEAQQANIRALEMSADTPAKLKVKLKEYEEQISGSLQNGEDELKNAIQEFHSPEAQNYVENSLKNLGGYVQQIAETGFDIVSKSNGQKDISNAQYESIPGLSKKLLGELGVQKKELANFKQLKETSKQIDDELEAEKKLFGRAEPLTLTDWLAGKDALSARLKAFTTKIPASVSSGEASLLQEKLRTKIDTEVARIEKEKSGLPLAAICKTYPQYFTVDALGRIGFSLTFEQAPVDRQNEIRADFFHQNFESNKNKILATKTRVVEYQKLTADFLRNPSEQTYAKIAALKNSLNLKTLADEVFGQNMHAGEGKNQLEQQQTQQQYQQLYEAEYLPLQSTMDSLNDKVEAVERESVSNQAVATFSLIEMSWPNTIGPKVEAYKKEVEALQKDPENKDLLKNENILLGDLFKTQNLLGRFITHPRLDWEIKDRLKKKNNEIQKTIDEISSQKLDRLNKKSLQQADQDLTTDNISQYVRAVTAEEKATLPKDKIIGDSYTFTPAFYDLKERHSQGAMNISTLLEARFRENQGRVHDEVENARRETLPADERALLDQKNEAEIKNALGVNGELFFQAKALVETQPQKAEQLFQYFVAQNEKPQRLESKAEKMRLALVMVSKDILKSFATDRVKTLETLYGDVLKLKTHGRAGGTLNEEDVSLELTNGFSLQQAIQELKQKVAHGDVINFNEEYGTLKGKVEKVKGKSTLFDKLDTLYQAIYNSTNPEEKKKALADFAQEATDIEAFDLGRKYYQYALKDVFEKKKTEMEKSGKGPTLESVKKRMMEDPKLLLKIKAQAAQNFAQYKKENPGLRVTESMHEQIIFNMELKKRYQSASETAVRHQLMIDGEFNRDPVLQKFQDDYPVVPADKWDPFTYGAEEMAEFKKEIAVMVWTTLPTLGVAAGAGAVGRATTEGVLEALMARGAPRAVIQAVEKEGLMALRQFTFSEGSQALKALALAETSGFATENAAFVLLGAINEALQSGETPAAFKSLGEFGGAIQHSVQVMGVLRGMGTVSKMAGIPASIEKGGFKGAVNWFLSENLNSTVLTGLDIALAKVPPSQGELLKSYFSNYLVSIGHGIGAKGKSLGKHGEEASTGRIKEAYAKAKEEALLAKKPAPHVEKKQILSEAPLNADNPITLVHDNEGPFVAAHDVFPDLQAEAQPKLPEHFTPEELPRVEQELRNSKVSDSPQVKAKMIDLGVESIADLAKRITPKELKALLDGYDNLDFGRIGRLHELESVLSPEGPNGPKIKALMEGGDPLSLERIKELSENLSNQEIDLLLNSIDRLDKTLIKAILKRDCRFARGVRGGVEVNLLYYKGERIGQGGMADINDAAFIPLDKNHNITGDQLNLKTVKIQRTDKKTDKTGFAVDEANALKDVLKFPDKTGLLPIDFVGEGPLLDGDQTKIPVIIAEKIEPLPGLSPNETNLDKALHKIQPEDVLDCVGKGADGLMNAHRNGKIHLDVKPGNIFVGTIHGEAGAWMGDLSLISVEDVAHFKITPRPDWKSPKYEMVEGVDNVDGIAVKRYRLQKVADTITTYIVEKTLPDGSTQIVPMTPAYAARCGKQLMAMKEYIDKQLKESSGKKIEIPQHIVELADKAELAETLDRVKRAILFDFGPYDVVKRLVDEPLSSLINRMDVIDPQDPSFINLKDAMAMRKAIQENIKKARLNGDLVCYHPEKRVSSESNSSTPDNGIAKPLSSDAPKVDVPRGLN